MAVDESLDILTYEELSTIIEVMESRAQAALKVVAEMADLNPEKAIESIKERDPEMAQLMEGLHETFKDNSDGIFEFSKGKILERERKEAQDIIDLAAKLRVMRAGL